MQDAEREILRVEQEEALRAARRHLLPFTLWTFPGYEVNWHHRVIADKLTAFAFGLVLRLILCVPPRRGKSELASRRLPPFIFGADPDARIIACSYAADLATDNSRDAKRIILSDEYRAVFPNTTLNPRHVVTDDRQATKNTADQWEIVGHAGAYLARGVGGGITGKGFTHGIIDDPVKDEEQARSQTYRDSLWRWYTKVFHTRRAPGAGILLIMTRWHQDDLVGRLLEEARTNPLADQWEVIEFREIREGDDNPDDPRELGEVLWPNRYPLTDALAYRSTDPAGFASLFQQRPAPEEGAIIKLAWTERRYDIPPQGTGGDWLQSWDLKAGSKDPRSSYVVGQVWCRPPQQVSCYLVDQVRGRWDIVETMEQVRALSVRWPQAHRKLVEDKADGRAVVTMLQDQIHGLIPTRPEGDKVTRARAVEPLWQAGNVILPSRRLAPWIEEYVHEITTFPGAANDDQVDATTQALRWYMDNAGAEVAFTSGHRRRWASTRGLVY